MAFRRPLFEASHVTLHLIHASYFCPKTMVLTICPLVQPILSFAPRLRIGEPCPIVVVIYCLLQSNVNLGTFLYTTNIPERKQVRLYIPQIQTSLEVAPLGSPFF